MVARIGNGLYAHTKIRLSLMEQYRQLQASCEHKQRDPRGTCYRCGHRETAANCGTGRTV
jgi:membrane protease subunit (stomatin/prohibitin family)